jgi:hypothetical protein
VSHLPLLLDVSPGPGESVGWGPLLILLTVVFVLSVAVAGGLVVLLIWLKRRKQPDS